MASCAHPARDRWASSLRAANRWPAPTTPASRPALVSSAICLNRSRSSSFAVSSTSDASDSRSPTWERMALPDSTTKAAGESGLPRTSETEGLTEKPPVLRPMRSVSSTNDSASVPICVSERQKSGTRGRSLAGIARMGSSASR